MEQITKTQDERWFVIQDTNSGEPGLVIFGNCPLGLELTTGQPNLATFLTEDELEIAVDNIAEITDYYKDAVESDSPKFQQPSEKYPT